MPLTCRNPILTIACQGHTVKDGALFFAARTVFIGLVIDINNSGKRTCYGEEETRDAAGTI